MASEYLNKKYADVQPEKPVERTKQEKWKNWWHYHKWHLVIGAVILIILVTLVQDISGNVEPDYYVSYVGASSLPEETEEALEQALSAYGIDRNGDGETVVQVHSYQMNGGQQQEAAMTSLAAEIHLQNMDFFLLEDPVAFQRDYGVLCLEDGSAPQEDTPAEACLYYAWDDCPNLKALELGSYTTLQADGEVQGDSQQRLSGLYLARYASFTEEQKEKSSTADSLWMFMIEGG